MSIDDLPYKLHTGRELKLMLTSIKPMSYFVYYNGNDDYLKEIEVEFEESVKGGRIVEHRRSVLLPGGARSDYIIYTLPNECWRADALILLKEVLKLSPWSEGMERYEGSLLGYTDIENDLYIEYLRKNGFSV